MPLYGNKKSQRTSEVTEDLKKIITDAVAYDKLHRLYNRIASNPEATTADCIAFNILQGTPLAESTHSRVPDPGTKTVVISIKKSGYLMHLLSVTTPNHKGVGKEDGVKEILIYKAIAPLATGIPALSLFQYIGDVSRGSIKVNHEDANQGMRAWYIGKVKNSRGEIGDPNEPVGFIII